MNTHDNSYKPPVDKLLTYGDCRDFKGGWPNYLELGFTQEHIPGLIEMALDEDLHWADSESLEVWAPIYAWRTLGQLQAEEALEPLLEILEEADEDDDWARDDLPRMYGKIGAKAIPFLTELLRDPNISELFRGRLILALSFAAEEHPELRDECIDLLCEQLRRFTDNQNDTNAFIVGHLVDLKAVNALDLIREGFEKECIDYSIGGDIEEIEISMELRTERSTPPDSYPSLAEQFYFIKEAQQKREEEAFRKAGRNDPCPCGSGKKYKKCCLNRTKDPEIREFLSLASKKQIVYADAAEKQYVLELIRNRKNVPAMNKLREMTGVEDRLLREYIKRLREEMNYQL